MSYVPPNGPPNARIMLVGEAPGEEEVRHRAPFVGQSGQELDKMLHDAGINRSECFATNVARYRPLNNDITQFIPKTKSGITSDMVMYRNKWVKPVVAQGCAELIREIDLVKPNVIVALGNTPLWALTGSEGITKWRGSLLDYQSLNHRCKLFPAYHPAAVLRQWDWRFITVHDFRRVGAHQHSPGYEMPAYNFRVRPNYQTVVDELERLIWLCNEGPTQIAVDIETRGGHIACVGLAWSSLDALCIPLMCIERQEGFWDFDSELAILTLLRRLMTHPNFEGVFQNGLYDCQYFVARMGFRPRTKWDTMLLHHVLFAGLPKGLDFLSSLYCGFHRYWKEEGKLWDASMPEEELWIYNCKDAVVTFEVIEALLPALKTTRLSEQAVWQMELYEVLLDMMIRGVRVNLAQKAELVKTLGAELDAREGWINTALGHPLNIRSPKQMKELFYHDFAQPIIKNRKTKQPTLDDEALQTIAKREPLLRPLIRRISEARSLGVFKSTFAEAEVDLGDLRMRSSYNAAGTDTYRLSSSKDAFGSGMNLQNIPAGGSVEKDDPTALILPNVRTLYIPDEGYEFFDADLDRADLQVVVWEADDADLKLALRKGVDLHILNGCLLFNKPIPPLDELVESHPNYKRWKAIFKVERQFAKIFVHGTNYGGSDRTMAGHTGATVHSAGMLQARWFGAHPGIKRWHNRVADQLNQTRCATNRFGYRRYFFDRIDSILPEALAWGPQSTVAIVIDRGIIKVRKNLTPKFDIQVLMQVHDSANGQFPIGLPGATKLIHNELLIEIPYEDPLTIPVGVKTSRVSWGDCE